MVNGKTFSSPFCEEFDSYLERLPQFEHPVQELEQYDTPVSLIRRLIYLVEQNNLKFSRMLDLGCGVGRIGLAFAKYYPSVPIIGLDVSFQVILSAYKFAIQEKISNIQFIVTPLEFFEATYYHDLYYSESITIMNPPFGVYHPGIDMLFLRKALECTKYVIGIFKSHNSLRKVLDREKRAFNADLTIYKDIFPIKKQEAFQNHRKPVHNVQVEICYFVVD